MEDMQSIWNQVLSQLADEVSRVSYDSWIKPIRPVAMTESSITLEVPFSINKNMVMTKYFSLIESCLEAAASRHFDIEVQVEEGNEPAANRQDPLTEENTLNPRYTFETYVVGNNSLPYAASLAVAEAPAQKYNPLLLYGGSGLGKTHLMQSIGHYVKQNDPNKKVLYTTCEKFNYELVTAIREKTNQDFRNKYRTVDLLLLDDIQFLGTRGEFAQEEFFHTFNALHEAGKQIVLTSDRLPSEIPHLEDRLKTRFNMGLPADVQPPDYETRMAILRNKLQMESLTVSEDIVEYVADNIKSNVRDLEGAVKRILAYAGISRTNDISMELAQKALKDILSSMPQKQVTMETIINEVEKYYNLSKGSLISKKRSKEIAYPRQIAMYISREVLDESYPRIGTEFGGRDHTTVMHAIGKIKDELSEDSGLDTTIKELVANINKN
uniref:Chromosomal replication initiator protein DnaA n=1 Tax=uncultured Bacillota bacterium TaxID=344338 RepID=A0A650F4W2_9FIRM|nr:chromosomal replication initiator protein DnaA [uncultured Firmicutes bacterium]